MISHVFWLHNNTSKPTSALCQNKFKRTNKLTWPELRVQTYLKISTNWAYLEYNGNDRPWRWLPISHVLLECKLYHNTNQERGQCGRGCGSSPWPDEAHCNHGNYKAKHQSGNWRYFVPKMRKHVSISSYSRNHPNKRLPQMVYKHNKHRNPTVENSLREEQNEKIWGQGTKISWENGSWREFFFI